MFRRVVPKEIRPLLNGKREIRRSLKLHHRPRAVMLARRYAMATDDLFEKLRKITTLLDQKEHELYERLCFDELPTPIFPDATVETETEDGGNQESLPDLTEAENFLNAIYEEFDPGSDTNLAIEGLTAATSQLQEAKKHILDTLNSADLEDELGFPLDSVLMKTEINPANAPSREQKLTPSPNISTLWADYTSEHRSSWADGTIAEHQTAFAAFKEIVGDIAISDFTIEVARQYKKEYIDYPVRRTLGKNKDKSLEELRQQTDARVAEATVATRMGMINAFLNWAADHKYLHQNHLSNIVVQRDKRTRKKLPFNPQDLKLIFSQPQFTSGHVKNAWEFWLPIIAIYTGARINEICQLRGSDIQTHNGITYFNIHDDGNTLKTRNSIRKIPIHHHLKKLGILELAQRVGGGFLFEITQYNKKRGHYPSKRFSTFKTSLGMGQSKSFHSFRHNFRDALTTAGAQPFITYTLMGHSSSDITFTQYGSDATMQQLNEAVQRIDYGRVFAGIRPPLKPIK